MTEQASDPDLEAVRAQLEARRDETRERIAALSRLTDIGVGDSLERTLARTDRALAKLDDGTYGICDTCGEPISPGRLRALPDGVLCLSCSASAPRAQSQRRR